MKKNRSAPIPIIEQLKEYALMRIRLAKYMAIEKGTAIAADFIADLAMIFCLLLAFLFASVTLAFFLATILGSNWVGFGWVALLYLLLALLVKVFKKSFERPIINALISKLLK